MRTKLPDVLRLRSRIMIMVRENQEILRTATEETDKRYYRAHLKSLQQDYDDCMIKVKGQWDLTHYNISVALKDELANIPDPQEKQTVATKPQLPII